jgi:hypothetical protein
MVNLQVSPNRPIKEHRATKLKYGPKNVSGLSRGSFIEFKSADTLNSKIRQFISSSPPPLHKDVTSVRAANIIEWASTYDIYGSESSDEVREDLL